MSDFASGGILSGFERSADPAWVNAVLYLAHAGLLGEGTGLLPRDSVILDGGGLPRVSLKSLILDKTQAEALLFVAAELREVPLENIYRVLDIETAVMLSQTGLKRVPGTLVPDSSIYYFYRLEPWRDSIRPPMVSASERVLFTSFLDYTVSLAQRSGYAPDLKGDVHLEVSGKVGDAVQAVVHGRWDRVHDDFTESIRFKGWLVSGFPSATGTSIQVLDWTVDSSSMNPAYPITVHIPPIELWSAWENLTADPSRIAPVLEAYSILVSEGMTQSAAALSALRL